jgi:hypothetical protein
MNKTSRLIGLIVAIVVVLGGGYFLLNRSGVIPGSIVKDSGSNVSDYSAVFLTNGQVYFGKMTGGASDEVDITDIFYLQVNQQQGLQPTNNTANSSTATPDISLVKLGNELHGPNDKMRINRTQVLFTESLKSDSKVVKAITDYKAK